MGQLERGSTRSEKVVKKLIRNACFSYVALRVSVSLEEGPSSSLSACLGGVPSLAAASAGVTLLLSLVLEQV